MSAAILPFPNNNALTPHEAELLQSAILDEGGKSVALPEFYEVALTALKECEQTDECERLVGVAAMIGVYAKQAKDDRMLKLAKRLNARAWRRLGELLKQFPVGLGGHSQRLPDDELKDRNSLKRRKAPPAITRRQVAEAHGISEGTRSKAVRIAGIPLDVFEGLVESEDPPSGNQLLHVNRTPEEILAGRSNAKSGLRSQTFHATKKLGLFARNHTARDCATCFTPDSANLVRGNLARIIDWLTSLEKILQDKRS